MEILASFPFVFGIVILAILIQCLMWIVKTIGNYQKMENSNKEFDGPTPHWLFGNIRDAEYGKAMYRGISLTEKYGPAIAVKLGPFTRRIMLTSPENIKTVMSTAEPKDRFYLILQQWIGDGLLVSKGKKWARNRRLLTPAFHFDILKPYQKVFSNCSSIMIEKWKGLLEQNDSNSIDMFEHVSLMTLDSLMKCIFGKDEDFQREKKQNPYIAAVYELSRLAVGRIRFPLYLNYWIYYFSYSGYKFRRAVKVTHDYSSRVIDHKKEQKEQAANESIKQTKKYLDFLDILLDCRDDEGKGLTIPEIQDEVDTFMFEGHDTTASGISWCLYNLARHPEYQEKCRKEVEEVLGEKNEVEWDDLSQMTYLTMCIKESLRIHPPVATIGRQLTKPITLPDGRVIPEGTKVAMNIYTCHHNPKVWDNPEIYDPERFNPDSSMVRHTHSFIPFSAGPRNCIGQHFAMNELKTAIALVLKNFRLQLDGSRPAEPLPALVIRSTNGVWLHVNPV